MPPRHGPIGDPELDQVVTGLFSITEVVRRVIEEASGADGPAEPGGFAATGPAAERLRSMLAWFEDFYSDRELGTINEFLAFATRFAAEQGGWNDILDRDRATRRVRRIRELSPYPEDGPF